jgi:hypothetical protein
VADKRRHRHDDQPQELLEQDFGRRRIFEPGWISGNRRFGNGGDEPAVARQAGGDSGATAQQEPKWEKSSQASKLSGFPSRPARSWVNCQAVRPEREPRVVAHSSA